METTLPRVTATFLVTGKEMDLDQVTSDLEVEPTKKRTKEDWPKSIRESKNLPQEYQPRYEWSHAVEQDNCYESGLVLTELISKFDDKSEILKKIEKDMKVEYAIVLTIQIADMDVPETNISKSTMSFCVNNNIELLVNVYDSSSE